MKAILILSFIALQGVDIATTQSFLSSGNAVEGNPVMALAMGALGDHWWLAKLAMLAIVVPVLASSRASTRYAAAMVALYSLIIVNNLLVM